MGNLRENNIYYLVYVVNESLKCNTFSSHFDINHVDGKN